MNSPIFSHTITRLIFKDYKTLKSDYFLKTAFFYCLLAYFTDPDKSPLIKNLPRSMYTSSVGNAVIKAPAIWTFHSTIWLPARFCKATVTGWVAGLWVRVTAKRNSFQMLVNCQIMTTAKAGSDMGNTIYKYIIEAVNFIHTVF